MKRRAIYFSATIAAAIFSTSVSSEAAGQLRVKFSFDGLATCDQPAVTNFPIHGEGTGVLSTDRTAELDMNSSIEGRVQYRAKLGGAPTEAWPYTLALCCEARDSSVQRKNWPETGKPP